MSQNLQWVRNCLLVVSAGDQKTGGPGIDLSQLRIKFRIEAAAVESPNNAAIRVYNVADGTVEKVRKEFTRVTLQAGYKNGATGVIFDGTVRQYGWGRENETDTYLDIFASEGDLQYNWTFMNQTLAAGATRTKVLEAIAKQMNLEFDGSALEKVGGIVPLPRGKVMFGMGRVAARSMAATLESTWSIHGGKLVVTPLTAYLPGEPVKINMGNGMIGIPEQTDQGISVRTLLNPLITVGQRVQLNNKDIAQKEFTGADRGHTPFNRNTGVPINLATVGRGDGIYQVYAIDYHGDTRGQEWYSDLTLLSIDPSSDKVTAS